MLKNLSFTKRYILALTIIALLSTLAYFNLHRLISSQANDAELIQMSERQKLLIQKIALSAIYYKIKDLHVNLYLLEKSHVKLLKAEMPKAIKSIYHKKPSNLNARIEEFVFHANRFHIHRDGRSQNFLLENVKPLSLYYDRIVSIYLNESAHKTENLKKVELFILLFTLVTLVLEALFIFLPADISINKKTKEIIAQKDYSNAVIESSTNAIITLDADMKIRTFNRAAENIFGFSKEEMKDITSLEKLIPQEYRHLHVDGMENFLQNAMMQRSGEVFEAAAVNKQGEIFPVRISMGSSADNEGIAIVANIQDISKEKLKDRILQQQAKFAALGEMVAIIAHQWRQPLAELNFNYMYMKKKIKNEELIEEFSKNEEIIRFMSDTITNFEDFYKHTDNSEFEPVTSIEQAERLLKSILHLNQIKLEVNNEFYNTIYGNVNALAQVILSIIQNIVDVVRLRGIEKAEIFINLKAKEENLVITIKDNAGGIQVEPIDEIFKPFTSSKKRSSTGIGLYMSKLVIEEKFHGEIKARNRDGGAEFAILLPLNHSII